MPYPELPVRLATLALATTASVPAAAAAAAAVAAALASQMPRHLHQPLPSCRTCTSSQDFAANAVFVEVAKPWLRLRLRRQQQPQDLLPTSSSEGRVLVVRSHFGGGEDHHPPGVTVIEAAGRGERRAGDCAAVACDNVLQHLQQPRQPRRRRPPPHVQRVVHYQILMTIFRRGSALRMIPRTCPTVLASLARMT